MLNQRMVTAKHYICLFIDNFKGCTICYKPHHIQMEYFVLNLTSFVQPLDICIEVLSDASKHTIDKPFLGGQLI
jgi:hypothetical protein